MPLVVSRITEGRIGLPQNHMDLVRQGVVLVIMLKFVEMQALCQLFFFLGTAVK